MEDNNVKIGFANNRKKPKKFVPFHMILNNNDNDDDVDGVITQQTDETIIKTNILNFNQIINDLYTSFPNDYDNKIQKWSSFLNGLLNPSLELDIMNKKMALQLNWAILLKRV